MNFCPAKFSFIQKPHFNKFACVKREERTRRDLFTKMCAKKAGTSTDTIIKWEDDDDSHFHLHHTTYVRHKIVYDRSRAVCEGGDVNDIELIEVHMLGVDCVFVSWFPLSTKYRLETNDHCENVPWKVRKIINLTHAQWDNGELSWSYVDLDG